MENRHTHTQMKLKVPGGEAISSPEYSTPAKGFYPGDGLDLLCPP